MISKGGAVVCWGSVATVIANTLVSYRNSHDRSWLIYVQRTCFSPNFFPAAYPEIWQDLTENF